MNKEIKSLLDRALVLDEKQVAQREFIPDSAVKTYDIEEAEKKDSGSEFLG